VSQHDNRIAGLSPQLREEFRSPPAVHRGAPFWAWNARLNKDRLCRQIEWFHEMGLGGFFMHPRTGLDTEYSAPSSWTASPPARTRPRPSDVRLAL